MPLHNMFGESDDESLGMLDSALRSDPNLLGLLNGGGGSRAPTPASQFFLDTLTRATPDFLGMIGSSGGATTLGASLGAAGSGGSPRGKSSGGGAVSASAAPQAASGLPSAPNAAGGRAHGISDSGKGGPLDPLISAPATTNSAPEALEAPSLSSLLDRPGSTSLSHLDPSDAFLQHVLHQANHQRSSSAAPGGELAGLLAAATGRPGSATDILLQVRFTSCQYYSMHSHL